MSISVLCRYIINLAMIMSNPSDNAIRDCVSIALNDFVSKVTLLYLDPDQHDEEWTELDEDIFPKIEYFAPKFNGEGLQILYLNNMGNPCNDLKIPGFEVNTIAPLFFNSNGMPEGLKKESFGKGISYYNIDIGFNNNRLGIYVWLEYLRYRQSWPDRFRNIIKHKSEVSMEEKFLYGYNYIFEYDCENGFWALTSCGQMGMQRNNISKHSSGFQKWEIIIGESRF